ncbi:hypothetical protein QWZ14_01960 [Paeniroseomonas aquatica]|uniref:Uncharacterized protein n=1 Tax=Paeniroseomonas aquatica TaxID=373043 RepID=A0ABT8A0B4_9PROT|nr:hypothetical protein [Paeniroseomonas aquatica]MDN3563142.1 hypothetical protein [Paeniroseomonas aquatica]
MAKEIHGSGKVSISPEPVINGMNSAEFDVAIRDFVILLVLWTESEIRCARLLGSERE